MSAFNLINKLYFERVTGSKQEHEAAQIIKNECEKLGINASIESIDFESYQMKKAELKLGEQSIHCVGVGMAGSTNGEIEKEFVYVASEEEANMYDVENKICLIHGKFVNRKMYKILADKKVAGIILCTGSVYENSDEVDLNPYIPESCREYASIPIVCISMIDAEKLVNKNPKTVTMNVDQERVNKVTNNVVAEIKGKSEEQIVFTAHLDTVKFSKGAYDNASGCASIMNVLQHFSKCKPEKTLKFVWCGCEEFSMAGSKHYVASHKEDMDKTKLCVNIDMAGLALGYDKAIVTANNELADYIKGISEQEKFPITMKVGVYGSDSTSFAKKGVPAVSFGRFALAGGAVFHNRHDVIERLSEEKFNNTCNFVIKFVESIMKDEKMLNEPYISEEMRKNIEEYASF